RDPCKSGARVRSFCGQSSRGGEPVAARSRNGSNMQHRNRLRLLTWLAMGCAVAAAGCGARSSLYADDIGERPDRDGAVPDDQGEEPTPDAASASSDADADRIRDVISNDISDATISPEDAHEASTVDPGQVVQLALGSSFSCALLASHRVRCWGLATAGQLG